MSFPNVEQFINLMIGVQAEGYQNAFVYVMSEWTKQQGKFLCTFAFLPRKQSYVKWEYVNQRLMVTLYESLFA